MNVTELCELGLVEAAALLRHRQLSPVELVQALLQRIAVIDARVNSFIAVTSELALEMAHQAEKDLVRGSLPDGSAPGLLHGVPVAIKDLFETRAIRTTAGSKFFSDFYPEQDASVVEKLRQAGAILIGKTNMHEVALGLTSVNPHFGAVHNPWALERIVGGSSGGSAAALAARLCPGALGSDTGGSIRVPASLCGIAGLKPTFGRVSLRGAIPLSWNLDHAGPMARCSEDLAALLQVTAGYDPGDPNSVDLRVDDYAAHLADGVAGWKIALAEDAYFDKTDEQVRYWIDEAAKVFRELGAVVERTPFPSAYQAALANGMMVTADAAVFHHERLRSNPEDFGADVLERLRNGANLPIDQYIRARRDQVILHRQFEDYFKEFNLLLLPTTPVAAPLIEGPNAVEMARLLTRYTAPFNLTGLPALSIPCGFTREGLPVGLQMVTHSWGEADLLQAAFAYEAATQWHKMAPSL
jgi:aspartyl-tRNA(Asn)/glutamyl-tRNA(Gln) amidotransferase subunit A